MQQRRDTGFLHERVGNPLEHFRIERVTQRLRLRHRSAHRLGTLLELDTDALAINRLLVAIPGKALDAYLRNVAAKAAIAVDQRRARTGARGGQEPQQDRRPAANHQDIGLQNHIDRAGGFSNLLHRTQAYHAGARPPAGERRAFVASKQITTFARHVHCAKRNKYLGYSHHSVIDLSHAVPKQTRYRSQMGGCGSRLRDIWLPPQFL